MNVATDSQHTDNSGNYLSIEMIQTFPCPTRPEVGRRHVSLGEGIGIPCQVLCRSRDTFLILVESCLTSASRRSLASRFNRLIRSKTSLVPCSNLYGSHRFQHGIKYVANEEETEKILQQGAAPSLSPYLSPGVSYCLVW